MMRTIFAVGIFTLLGLFALKLVFGVLGVAFALFGFLLGLALKIALIGGVVYLAIRIVSPSSASKLRDRWGQ